MVVCDFFAPEDVHQLHDGFGDKITALTTVSA
ncbi:hypothetical protein FBZ93_116143 [Bradyrhizobium macuxiense]|uniref:Uncharacterized protein n=1 Tax=Bradyrhizobium macuxiense TaxID=1755647 RepID=A0A560L1M1_9BRAD|nr:hypothetical protein FBZ93_116143 [Bradyrhizobium macuxiense]